MSGESELEGRTFACERCGRIGFGWGWSVLTELDPETGDDLEPVVVCDECEPWADESGWKT